MGRKIQHVVIIVKENHTFDNYFGTDKRANGAILGKAADPPPDDPHHDHWDWMRRDHDTKHRVQYDRDNLPIYFYYAENYTLCDNYYSEVAGPSTPNHLMLIGADAPIIENPIHNYKPERADAYDLRSFPMALQRRGLSWGNYGGYAFCYFKELLDSRRHFERDCFVEHVRRHRLPAVSWVYGDGDDGCNEHPTAKVEVGMQWTARQVDAIVEAGLWDRVAIFVTWDDWGGWFDHVNPPVKEKWDHSKAQRDYDKRPYDDGQPVRYGSRVPCLVLSPYAKKRHVSKQENSHVSLLKFCERTFRVPSMNRRDRRSNGMSDCFDLSQPALPPPPPAHKILEELARQAAVAGAQ